MKLSVTLQQKVIEFLTSLPNIDEIKSRRAFIYSVGLDARLKNQIHFDDPPGKFVPLLVSTLIEYGKLEDGRYALEAVLKQAKNYVGQDRQQDCDILMQEISITRDLFIESPKNNPDEINDAPKKHYTGSIDKRSGGVYFENQGSIYIAGDVVGRGQTKKGD